MELVSFNVRPEKKFIPEEIKGTIRDVVHEHLDDKVYDHMYATDWTNSLTRAIHDKIKELELKRYKYAVQVIIGEDRGQGLKCLSGCMWDEETDDKVIALYTAETMFCVAVVFVAYSYCYK